MSNCPFDCVLDEVCDDKCISNLDCPVDPDCEKEPLDGLELFILVLIILSCLIPVAVLVICCTCVAAVGVGLSIKQTNDLATKPKLEPVFVTQQREEIEEINCANVAI